MIEVKGKRVEIRFGLVFIYIRSSTIARVNEGYKGE